MKEKSMKETAEKLYEQFEIPGDLRPKHFEIWEVPPLPPGIKLYTEIH